MKMRILVLASFILFSFAAMAADINGTWTGKMCCSEAGSYPVILTLKIDGDKVTGSLAQGKAAAEGKPGQAITDGSFKDGQVLFSYSHKAGDQDVTVKYTVKPDGENLLLTEDRGQGRKPKNATLSRQ